jgi:membrane-bound lytic murein transglycosylase F
MVCRSSGSQAVIDAARSVAVGWTLTAVLATMAGGCTTDDQAQGGAPVDVDPFAKLAAIAVEDSPPGPARGSYAVVSAGRLRVLIHEPAEATLPRIGSPADRERAFVEQFARTLGVPIQWVTVPTKAGLLDALVEGRGDLVAAQLTRTTSREARVRFSKPLRAVQEVVVVPSSTTDVPRSLGDLAGRVVHLRPSSSHAETVKKIENVSPPPTIGVVPEALDTESILYGVGTGRYPLSIVDSDSLESYLAYRDDVQKAFVIRDAVPIGWAMHPEAHTLHDAVDKFLDGLEPVLKRRFIFGGDLDAIKRRGLLRVVLPNHSASYYLLRGEPVGQQYELVAQFAERQGLRLEVIVPRQQSDMIPLLLNEHADLIGATLSITPEREAQVAFASPLLVVDELLVQPADEAPITSLQQLAGREVHVRSSSSYWRSLEVLKREVPDLKIVAAPEHLETEQLIAAVGAGTLPMTVADAPLVSIQEKVRIDIQGTLSVATGRRLAYGVRKDAPQLLKALDAFTHEVRQDLEFGASAAAPVTRLSRRVTPPGALSPYDDLAKRVAERHGLDWRLVVAVMEKETGFDPGFETRLGKGGLMGLPPRIARRYGAPDPTDPAAGLEAGAAYLGALMKRYEALGIEDRVPVVLAAFKIGPGHVADARRVAVERELSGDRWEGHIDEGLRALADPNVASRARFGYCTASSAVEWVNDVMLRYERLKQTPVLGSQ